METGRPLFIPVILGTARMGRMSLHAAQLVTAELGKCAGVETTSSNQVIWRVEGIPQNDAKDLNNGLRLVSAPNRSLWTMRHPRPAVERRDPITCSHLCGLHAAFP
jgi:hypothetical protein